MDFSLGIGLWCLTPLSIFQLYHGCYWFLISKYLVNETTQLEQNPKQ